jgi:hypothetical protein
MGTEPPRPREDRDDGSTGGRNGSGYRPLLDRVSTRLLLIWLAFVVLCAGLVAYWELTGWFDH